MAVDGLANGRAIYQPSRNSRGWCAVEPQQMGFLEMDALAPRPCARHSTGTPCTSGASNTEEPQLSLTRHGGRRRRRLHLGFLGFLGALQGGRGGQAYQMEYIQITRPSTCPEGLERVLGWAGDVCSGMDAYNFDNMVLDLSKHGIMNYTRLHLTDTKFLDAVLKDCIFYANGGYHAEASEVLGTNGQFCPSAAMYYEGFQRSICDNRFLKSTFDARYPSNDTVTMTLTVPQGCNLACGCCGPGGNRCHKVLRITPDPLPVAAASAAAISPPMPPLMDTIDPNFHPPRPPPAPAPPGWPPPPPPPRRDDPPLGLLMFLHGYTGDASWATSQFWLHQLVDELNLMVIAPNGRTDGLGYSYWLGTDHFTGFFTARMNTTTGDEQHIPPERGSWQRMAADYEQFDVLVNKNPDLNYVTEMLLAAIRNHDVDPDRVFVFGSGMGGDLAYRLACEKADVITAVIMHDASPFPDERSYCQPQRPIHVLVWQQSGSEPARDRMLKFWEKENTCEPGEKLSHTLQLLYNATSLDFRRYHSSSVGPINAGRRRRRRRLTSLDDHTDAAAAADPVTTTAADRAAAGADPDHAGLLAHPQVWSEDFPDDGDYVPESMGDTDTDTDTDGDAADGLVDTTAPLSLNGSLPEDLQEELLGLQDGRLLDDEPPTRVHHPIVDDTYVYNARWCAQGSSVTLWMTASPENPGMDPRTFPPALSAYLTWVRPHNSPPPPPPPPYPPHHPPFPPRAPPPPPSHPMENVASFMAAGVGGQAGGHWLAHGERLLAHHPLRWVLVAAAAAVLTAIAGVGMARGVAAGRQRLRTMERRLVYGDGDATMGMQLLPSLSNFHHYGSFDSGSADTAVPEWDRRAFQ